MAKNTIDPLIGGKQTCDRKFLEFKEDGIESTFFLY